MKTIIAILAICALTMACTAPPEEVPRAAPPEEPVPEPEPPVVPPEPPAVDEPTMDAEERSIDFAQSSFTFTGYGPGKSHEGTFEQMDGTLMFQDGTIVGASGTIQAASLKSDSDGLDNHLKSEDFFEVETYPEITMEATEIADAEITGTLTFHGVTQELTFPATITENSIEADFVISLEQFGIAYTGVNDEVRIQFTLVA